MNVKYVTTINLFGKTSEQVYTVVVVLLSFAVGIVFSFILYFMSYLTRRRKARLSAREKTASMQRQEIAEREEEVRRMGEHSGTEMDDDQEKENLKHKKNSEKESGSGFSSLFRKRKKL
jgi:flagellar biosynthesis/type III secretory pathway M-ring protein FliF/YscJ